MLSSFYFSKFFILFSEFTLSILSSSSPPLHSTPLFLLSILHSLFPLHSILPFLFPIHPFIPCSSLHPYHTNLSFPVPPSSLPFLFSLLSQPSFPVPSTIPSFPFPLTIPSSCSPLPFLPFLFPLPSVPFLFLLHPFLPCSPSVPSFCVTPAIPYFLVTPSSFLSCPPPPS